MTYFYDYFAKEYRMCRKGALLPGDVATLQRIPTEDVQQCKRALKNSFAGYREGRNAEVLKKLLGEYRKYISGCYARNARDRYNAFVYQYMVEAYVGNRAIAARLGVSKETVWNYIDKCIDEMLMLCMGIPAVANLPKDGIAMVRVLLNGSRLFSLMAGDYVFCLFPGRKEQATVKQGRQITNSIIGKLSEAVEAYSEYCNDKHTQIDTNIRKAEILEKCLAGIPPAAIAKEYGCCEGTIYLDIRENEKRLSAMLFGIEDKG